MTREYYSKHRDEQLEYQRAYYKEHKEERIAYRYKYNSQPEERERQRIRKRDRRRLINMGFDLTDKQIHHIKYCADDDASWFENIRVYTRAQHNILHKWERMDHGC